MRDARQLGERIRQVREASKIEQADLADRAGLSRAYISRLENGGVQSPKLYDLAKVAEVLKTTVSDLTGDAVTMDDAAAIRALIGAKLGETAASQVESVLERLAERPEQDRRAVLRVLEKLVETLPPFSHH